MADQQQDQASIITLAARRARKATDEWLKHSGEHTMIAMGTVFVWSAAAHAAYLAAVPEPLRVSVSKRNQGRWKGLSLGALVAVACYDTLHSARLADQHRQLQAEARLLRLRTELKSYAPEFQH